MKKTIALFLALCLMACAFSVTGMSSADLVPMSSGAYSNPLTGEAMDSPQKDRIVVVPINNLPDALPHVNVVNADWYLETFVNDSIIRGLAFFTDLSGLDAIGSVRSNRIMFNDFAVHYDALIFHAGSSSTVSQDAKARKAKNINIDKWENIQLGASFRDQDRLASGYDYEHTLFAVGPELLKCAKEHDYRTTLKKGFSTDMFFVEDGTPQNSFFAENIGITITMDNHYKQTNMVYDASLGKYVYNQYGQAMKDGITGEPEAFTNVLILQGDIQYAEAGYQKADLVKGGTGWFACGGRAIPILWGSNDETSPLWFLTSTGEPLFLGTGNTYIALTQNGSNITGIV